MVVMPNHFHCIIEIVNGVGADLRVCPQSTDHHESDANVTSESNANVASESNVASGGRHIGLPLRPPIMINRCTKQLNKYNLSVILFEIKFYLIQSGIYVTIFYKYVILYRYKG